MMAMSEMRLSH